MSTLRRKETKMKTRILTSLAIVLGLAATARAQTPYVPYLVKDIEPGPDSSWPYPVGNVDGRVFFVSRQPTTAAVPHDLWTSTGTEDSTQLVLDVPAPRFPWLPFPWPLFTLGDEFYLAVADDGVLKTDGTTSGTTSIADIGIDTVLGVTNGGYGMFAGRVGELANRALPHVTDGSPQGTELIPLPHGVTMEESVLSWSRFSLTRFRNGFAMGMQRPMGDLWLHDPEASITTRVQPCGPNLVYSPDWMSAAALGELLIVDCYDRIGVSDGTAAGSHLVKVLPGGTNPRRVPMTPLAGHVYFLGPHGLWRTDGTAAGTEPMGASVRKLWDADVSDMVTSDGLLYFAAKTRRSGRELWRTDGTVAGTFLLRDIAPGETSGIPYTNDDGFGLRMVAVPGGVVFAAATSSSGVELWRSDGTPAGTVPLPEIAPGPASALITLAPFARMQRAGSRVFFSADDGVHGYELWAIDLPSAKRR
jgi:ELWxxDGT repeat protein